MTNLLADVQNRGGSWQSAPPATADSIANLERAAPGGLPRSYFAFLAACNGGEGSLGVEPGWIVFWPAERVMELNVAYGVFENTSGFYGFASNGAGELLAFDIRCHGSAPVVMIPFVPMDASEAKAVSPNFDQLLAVVGQL